MVIVYVLVQYLFKVPIFSLFFFLDTSVRIAGETGCLSFYICMRFLHY